LNWITSSYSKALGNCVEWRAPGHSYSEGNCVEARGDSYDVFLRDSKDSDGPVLTFSGSTWGRFLDQVKSD